MPVTLEVTPYQYLQLLNSEVATDPSSGVITVAVSFPRAWPLHMLRAAWHAMLRHHAGLRVHFRNDDGIVTQILRSFDELPPESRDLLIGDELGASSSPAGASSHVPAFEPFGTVLLQAVAVSNMESSARVLISVHHALVDAHALSLVVRFLSEWLEKSSNDQPQGSDARYVTAMQSLVATAEHAKKSSRDYWHRAFRPLPSSAVPHRAPAAPGGSMESIGSTGGAGRWKHTLSGEEVSSLRTLGRRANASPAIALHAALVILLQQYGLGARQAIGVPISLRDHSDVGFETVGLFLNVLPLVTTVSAEDTFRQVIEHVRHDIVGLQEHKFTPLANLAQVAGVSRASLATADTSYFGIILAVQEAHGPAQTSEAEVDRRPLSEPPAPLSIEITLSTDGGQISVGWQDGVALWPSADELTRHLLLIVRLLINDLDVLVGKPHTLLYKEAPYLACPDPGSLGTPRTNTSEELSHDH